MSESLYIAASGMHAQQLNLDVIANNLANINTSSFKKSRVNFEDLMYRQISAAGGDLLTENSQMPLGVGSGLAGVGKVFSMGDVKKTEQPLDLVIQGSGFLEVMLPNGEYAYTRAGSMQLNEDGVLASSDGLALSSYIQVPDDAESIIFTQDGQVKVKLPQSDDYLEVGRIEIANFVNPAGLLPKGDNLYLPTESSGDPLYATPGEQGTGTINQGFLEASNVELVEELTNMVVAQRAYEINSKVIQASDEMLGIVNNLRR